MKTVEQHYQVNLEFQRERRMIEVTASKLYMN